MGTGGVGTAGTSTSVGGTPANMGGTAGNTNGAAGSAGTVGNGGVNNATGGGGSSAGGVSGGTDAGGTSGSAGTSGAGGSSAPSTMGTQMDPGIEGDGELDLPPPYDLPPESLGPVNGAPQGQLLGPIIYTQTGTYDNWDMWKFTYWVYVPSQYQAGHAAAIMILNDGLKYNGDQEATPSRFNTPQVFDNLIHEGAMPVTIGVFIDPGTDDGHHVGGGDGGRSRQYDTANDQYGKFILDEFIPSEITSNYDIVTDPDGWAMGGHSSGGNASVSVAWFYPDRLRKVLIASATLGLTGGVFPGAFLDVDPPKPLRIYHTAGSQDDGNATGPNSQLAENLMTMGYHYRYRPSEDVHYPPAAAAADYPDALRWLWRNYDAGH